MKIAIYDMDGTIVDSSHRYRTIRNLDNTERIDLGYWVDNQHKALHDKLLPLASQYVEDTRNPLVYTIIATARVMKNPDWIFVNEVLGKPNYFISRTMGDTRKGGRLKIDGLQKFFNLKQFRNAEAVFYEDNANYLKEVCDHFNIRGVYIPSVQGH